MAAKKELAERRPNGIRFEGVQLSAKHHSGPLPEPETLAKYEQVLPGCAERIVRRMEIQAEHRQAMEGIVIEGNTRAQARGQWLAFWVLVLALAAGFVLLWNGKSVEGLGVVISSMVAAATVFITGKRMQVRERERKAR